MACSGNSTSNSTVVTQIPSDKSISRSHIFRYSTFTRPTPLNSCRSSRNALGFSPAFPVATVNTAVVSEFYLFTRGNIAEYISASQLYWFALRGFTYRGVGSDNRLKDLLH